MVKICSKCNAIAADSEEFFNNRASCFMCGGKYKPSNPRDEYYASKQFQKLADETITHLQADIEQLKAENVNLSVFLEQANTKCEALQARLDAINRSAGPYEV